MSATFTYSTRSISGSVTPPFVQADADNNRQVFFRSGEDIYRGIAEVFVDGTEILLASGQGYLPSTDITIDDIILYDNSPENPPPSLETSSSLYQLLHNVPQIWVYTLRSSLSMREVPASGSVYRLSSQLGDEELKEDLVWALTSFNSWPPIMFSYSFVTLPEGLIGPVWALAEFKVGLRLQWFEAGKHFRYIDNGISIERVKQQDYANVGNTILSQLAGINFKLVKQAYRISTMGIKGQFSSMISLPRSIFKSLRGTRLGMGG